MHGKIPSWCSMFADNNPLSSGLSSLFFSLIVLTVISTSYGYTAEILEKNTQQKIVFNKVNNNFVYGKDIKKYL